ncbi:hypothetical protein TGRH88_046020 [Toxoplasma gondii]|uniref:Uncharacterized protein n=1 Tax=Toxoplasma gondii TaxID=5811 RepID=A0A7J6K294_TOXGO|nr:hypothetical protein TGRH88_046020 [Toxoplasma gondii]
MVVHPFGRQRHARFKLLTIGNRLFGSIPSLKSFFPGWLADRTRVFLCPSEHTYTLFFPKPAGANRENS